MKPGFFITILTMSLLWACHSQKPMDPPQGGRQPTTQAPRELNTSLSCKNTPPTERLPYPLSNSELAFALKDVFGQAPKNIGPSDDEPVGAAGWRHSADVQNLSTIRLKTLLPLLEDFAKQQAEKLYQNSNCQKSQCLIEVLEPYITKLTRQLQLNSSYRQSLISFADKLQSQGLNAQDRLTQVLLSVLLSPKFLFKVDGAWNTLTDAHLNQSYAERISWALWGSVPDQELLQLAASGKIWDREILSQKIASMLKDPKARRFSIRFIDQWMKLHVLNTKASSKALILRSESQAFFHHILSNNRDARDLIKSNYVMASRNSAAYYGWDLSGLSNNYQRIPISRLPRDEVRGGLLTQASLLTAYSHRHETSPVKRGKWIANNFLCIDVPPPNSIDDTVENIPNKEALTARERLAIHRQRPQCQGCHTVIDPVGLSLENFDSAGIWRDTDKGKPIDSSGELFNKAFSNPDELLTQLRSQPEFGACFSQKVASFLAARVIHKEKDSCLNEKLTERFAEQGYSLQDLIITVLTSDYVLK